MKTNVSYLQILSIELPSPYFLPFQRYLQFIQSLWVTNFSLVFKSHITETMDKKARVRRIWRDVKNFFRKKTSDYTKREPQLDLDELEDEDQRKYNVHKLSIKR